MSEIPRPPTCLPIQLQTKSPPKRFDNSIAWLAELRKALYLLSQFLIKKVTQEKLDTGSSKAHDKHPINIYCINDVNAMPYNNQMVLLRVSVVYCLVFVVVSIATKAACSWSWLLSISVVLTCSNLLEELSSYSYSWIPPKSNQSWQLHSNPTLLTVLTFELAKPDNRLSLSKCSGVKC